MNGQSSREFFRQGIPTSGMSGAEKARCCSPMGLFCNCFRVGQNAFEFVIDCGQCFTEDTCPRFHARLITNPRSAKALAETLREFVDKYEQAYGEIREE